MFAPKSAFSFSTVVKLLAIGAAGVLSGCVVHARPYSRTGYVSQPAYVQPAYVQPAYVEPAPVVVYETPPPSYYRGGRVYRSQAPVYRAPAPVYRGQGRIDAPPAYAR